MVLFALCDVFHFSQLLFMCSLEYAVRTDIKCLCSEKSPLILSEKLASSRRFHYAAQASVVAAVVVLFVFKED